ncbi:uncharacterized protein BHQ10_008333 [Talaromyces amestolkiae]|uniref:Major facilitator superfamily (MFS) profile domain-containing protein n=1 Tax=Talaromyces amestolkiae TaxID=1196081 RepID=A0A364L9E0_TALAM|nr:uncharacterized protein BHQ10_008333 [Talaromyces amestolkiae]RAO72321.1 hypothetical protein BHQ10_008333 [Talaromyces amestolkiae]
MATTMQSEKEDASHLESMPTNTEEINMKIDEFESPNLVKSTFDELSIPQTLWAFKRVILISLAVYTGYVCEGFELGAGGSIIANTGFIKQFGNKGDSGVRALDPTWVSTWSALLNVGQMVTFTYISWFADRFGRKTSLYVAWAWLVIGCVFLNTARSPSVWALAKLCNGAGIGVLQVTCQVYIMEICPNRIRGGMVTFQAVCGVKGYDIEEEYGIIVRTIEHERSMLQDEPKYIDIFKGLNLKRTLTVMLLAVSQQLAGLAIISTYSTYFFSLAGLADPFLGTVIISCVNLLAVLVWSFTTDKFGRRTIINTCQTVVCVILFLCGGLYWTGATNGNAKAGTGLLVICCFWTFAVQIIIMSYYLFSAELPSALLRVKTGPITFLTNSIVGVATCYATPPMLLALSLKTGFVYGAFSVPICVLMWLYLPETRSRSVSEIDELYERNIPAWRWSKTVTAAEEQMRLVVELKGVGTMEGEAKAQVEINLEQAV